MPRACRWPYLRVVVSGPSMVPALYSGDQLLVRRAASVRPGDLVVARFAGAPERLVVKRAVRPVEGGWWVVGDNPDGSDDSRRFGPAQVHGRVVWCYWPLLPRRAWGGSRRSA